MASLPLKAPATPSLTASEKVPEMLRWFEMRFFRLVHILVPHVASGCSPAFVFCSVLLFQKISSMCAKQPHGDVLFPPILCVHTCTASCKVGKVCVILKVFMFFFLEGGKLLQILMILHSKRPTTMNGVL